MAENLFEEYTPIEFQDVPVFWAKIFEGQQDTYKGKSRWKMDNCNKDDELYDELEDNNFNVKETQRKFLKLIGNEDEKLNAKGESEKARGNYIGTLANCAYEKESGEVVEFDPPLVVGPDCKPWDPKKRLGNGTICNVECHAKKWEDQSTVTLYLVAIQVLEYVEAPEGNNLPEAGSTFKKQEGTAGSTFKKKPAATGDDV